MKEIPILFNEQMVTAILNNSKTQTRRTVKPQPIVAENQVIRNVAKNDWWIGIDNGHFSAHSSTRFKCPYGQIGDLLLVRETFYAYGQWVKNGISKKTGKQKWKFQDWIKDGKSDFRYKFVGNPPKIIKNGYDDYGWFKRPSLFMPKIACRIRLQITGIRVERLHNISEKDAIAEGVEFMQEGEYFGGYWEYTGWRDYIDEMEHDNIYNSPIDSYKSLWESINGKESIESNPWVWVIEFKKP